MSNNRIGSWCQPARRNKHKGVGEVSLSLFCFTRTVKQLSTNSDRIREFIRTLVTKYEQYLTKNTHSLMSTIKKESSKVHLRAQFKDFYIKTEKIVREEQNGLITAVQSETPVPNQ